MTAQTRSTLKALFEDGDKPAGSDYADWIDSMVSIADTTAQTLSSDLVAPKLIATSEVSAPAGNFSAVSTTNLSVTGVVSASSANIGGIVNKPKIGPTGEQGDLVLSQRVTITNAATANTTVAVLASGSDVLDAYFFVTNALASAGADVEVRLGDADNETKYGTFSIDTNIATGMHHLVNGAFTSAGTSWLSVSGSAKTILAKVTAVSGALASGASGVMNLVYVHK